MSNISALLLQGMLFPLHLSGDGNGHLLTVPCVDADWLGRM